MAMGVLRILFGSQGGSAEEVARRIGREAYTQGYDYTVSSMNDYPIVGCMRLCSCGLTRHSRGWPMTN